MFVNTPDCFLSAKLSAKNRFKSEWETFKFITLHSERDLSEMLQRV